MLLGEGEGLVDDAVGEVPGGGDSAGPDLGEVLAQGGDVTQLAAAPLALAVPVELDVGPVRHEVVHPLVQRRAGPVRLGRGATADDDWSGPALDERVHHLMAHWPDVKLHWYGKGQRRGRKLGHVTALGEDLAEVRARAVAAARYLADGVVDAAFAFDTEH